MRYLISVLLLLKLSLAPISVCAETLRQGLVAVYANDHLLKNAQIKLRSAARGVTAANAGFLPRIAATAQYRAAHGAPEAETSMNVSVRQNLFSGFKDVNRKQMANLSVELQQYKLRQLEQKRFLEFIQLYSELYATEELLKVRREYIALTQEQVKASKVKLSLEEGTKTELAQAEANLAAAQADLSELEAVKKVKQLAYKRLVGLDIGQLEAPTLLLPLPKTLENALAAVSPNHVVIAAALRAVEIAEAQTRLAKADFAPSVDVVASAAKGFGGSGQSVFQMNVQVSMPIFEGGRRVVEVGKAHDELDLALMSLDDAKLSVQQEIIGAWTRLEGAKARLAAHKKSLTANQTAAAGVAAQYRVGEASMLDLLKQNSLFSQARVAIINDQREILIARYSLLAAMGQLDAETLGFRR